MTTIGSLFTGYGGLDLALEGVFPGARLAWVADPEPGPRKVLAHHWPDVPNLGDVTTVDWATVEPVDILTGGFPCQDVSHAGNRAGLRPGTRTGLWAHMVDAIAALRPALVVAENVRGLLSAPAHSDMEPCPWCMGDSGDKSALRALGAVLGTLADVGYDAAWTGLRAADVGAPHGRYRIFLAAWPTPPDTDDVRQERRRGPRDRRPQPTDSDLTAADTDRDGRPSIGRVDPNGGDPHRRNSQDQPRTPSQPTAWGAYGPAITRWEAVLGRPAPPPTERERLSPRFVEWMMGLPPGHVADVPGVTRTEALTLLGNGVVPQQAVHAVRRLLT